MSGNEFILILVLSGANYNQAATSILFPSQAACEHAKQLAEEKFNGFWARPTGRAPCLPRNTP
jgi:hypothetical protein